MHAARPERLLERLREGVDTSAAPDQQLWPGLLAFFTFVEASATRGRSCSARSRPGTGPFAADGAESGAR